MTWTVVEDNAVIQVRASISDSKELDELIESLQGKREFLQPPKEKNDE